MGVNPLGMPLVFFAGLVVLKMVGEAVLDGVILSVLGWMDHVKLPSRTNPDFKTKGLERLQAIDYTFLVLNQVVEAVFVVHLFHLMATELPLALADVSVANSIVAIYAIFIVDDALYYWLHRFMHHPVVYPYCHKHHHRQALPRRGYLDAANEHPLEQVGGLGCVWLALRITHAVVGVHAASALVFFVLYATLAMLNHTPYDVRLGEWWGLGYSVQAHESHHLLLRCNYAQNTMWFDKMLGTFFSPASSKRGDAAQPQGVPPRNV